MYYVNLSIQFWPYKRTYYVICSSYFLMKFLYVGFDGQTELADIWTLDVPARTWTERKVKHRGEEDLLSYERDTRRGFG